MLGFALLLGLLTAGANLAGSALALTQRRQSGTAIGNYIGFGGGFLLGAALLELLPEALGNGPTMPLLVIAGYLVVYLAEQLFATHAHEEPHGGLIPARSAEDPPAEHTLAREFQHPGEIISAHAALAALVGFNIHDFIDGLAIGAGLITSEALGLLIFLAVILHEVPAGFTISTIVLGAGRSRLEALLAGSSIGIVTLVGIVVPFLARQISEIGMAPFIALSAGSFIYIAATDLIPAGSTRENPMSFLYVVGGIVTFAATARLTGLLLG